MRWRGRRQSGNVEDRRGRRGISRGRGAGGGAMILLILAGLFFGEDVQRVLSLFVGGGGQNQAQQAPAQRSQAEEEVVGFVRTVLADTEDTWHAIFKNAGQSYRAPTLVLYEGRTPTACGTGSAASGPFYCPGDQKIYIDLSFMNELRRMGAPGDFAFAYVIAHEVGHHVQTLVGIASDVRQQQMRAGSKAQANAMQVKMELQADCFAGVWINHTERRSRVLEAGDIQEGLEAAAAVGDDRIMKSAGRTPRRENFTHGSSQERMQWFQRGMQTGDIQACQTFG